MKNKMKNKMKKIQQGFTLIELMITVAIIGILASIAIPAYQDYIVRAKIAPIIATMASLKQKVEEEFYVNGTPLNVIVDHWGSSWFPNYKYNGSLPPYVEQVVVLQGNIFADLKGGGLPADFKYMKRLWLISTINNGTVTWGCGTILDFKTVPLKYLPSSCREDVRVLFANRKVK